jgi:hypothetical protein
MHTTGGRRWFVALTVIAVLTLHGAQLSTAAVVDKSDNVELVASYGYGPDVEAFYSGGTDIAFSGRYVYAAEQGWEGNGGGVHIFDVARDGFRHVGFAACGGWQNDVAVVKPGLVAIGYHQGIANCGNKEGGITLVDVRNASKPKVLGSTKGPLIAESDPTEGYYTGVHTITAFPGEPLVYASPGGRQMQTKSREAIVDVSNPRAPKVVTTFETGIGCHDVSFSVTEERALGFCSGPGATEIWDVSDPRAPLTVGVIVNPNNFHHSNAVTSDGRFLAIGTETPGNDCVGGPSGAIYTYDITVPNAPVPLSYFGAPRGPDPIFVTGSPADCAAHLFNFVPGKRILVSGNYWGGMSVVDFGQPVPKELAHYRTEKTDYWAAYWHGGRVYANGHHGVDVFEVRGL